MFKRILVCVDSSINSESVFASALTLAQQNEATLLIVHILSREEEESPILPQVASGYYFPAINSDAYKYYQNQWDDYARKGQNLLEGFIDKAKEIGVCVEPGQSIGSPGRQICEMARFWKAELIVAGRSGHSGLSELFLGSVSNYILHHAHCSVLIVQLQPNVEVPSTDK